MAEAAAVIGVVTGLMGAYGTYQSGKIQQRMYNIKARQALIRSDQESLNEKRKGLAVLDKIMSTISTVNARSGAGAIDPYSGTPLVLQQFAMSEGMEDFIVTRENAQLIEQAGILESIDNKQAGAFAMYQARIGAIMQIGQAAASYAMIGGKPSGTTSAAGGPQIAGQTATSVPSGYGTMGASVPSNVPAYPR